MPTRPSPNSRPMTSPVGPPSSDPISTKKPPRPASSVKVLKVLKPALPPIDRDEFERDAFGSVYVVIQVPLSGRVSAEGLPARS